MNKYRNDTVSGSYQYRTKRLIGLCTLSYIRSATPWIGRNVIEQRQPTTLVEEILFSVRYDYGHTM